MRQSLFCVLPALMLAAVSASAAKPDIELTAWRGETVHMAVPFTNVLPFARSMRPQWSGNASALACVRARGGVVKNVQYAQDGKSAPDLVQWRWDSRPQWRFLPELDAVVSGGVMRAVGELAVDRSARPGVYDFWFCNRSIRLTVLDRVLPPAAEWK